MYDPTSEIQQYARSQSVSSHTVKTRTPKLNCSSTVAPFRLRVKWQMKKQMPSPKQGPKWNELSNQYDNKKAKTIIHNKANISLKTKTKTETKQDPNLKLQRHQ